ncbi:cysteine peptidase family C39 domain-containing protein [Paenibacillus guangzhouensis]|uniref:hypothetical protein n=1 Tax=Paenibacillus guangzhouensis TaxID=1473112 RepID=UPI001267828C|nr:hypothetical protein [Paenibacillus guangzhouensis]
MGNIQAEPIESKRKYGHRYIDALHQILAGQGWMTCPKSMLAGMTAASFRFTVDRRLTAESTSAYNWMAEHFVSADLLGLTTSQDAGFCFTSTFPIYRKQALRDIRRSLDRGMPCILWHDQFVVATGYDDTSEILFLSDGQTAGDIPLPFDQFGRGQSPYWYYQILEDRIALDEIEVYRESLVQAIFKWETHDLMLPEADYACGKAAHDAVIHAFRIGDYDPIGASEVLAYYADSKRDILEYVTALERYWPELHAATTSYRTVAQLWDEAVRFIATTESNEDHSVRIVMTELFQDANVSEGKAVQSLKHLMRETIHNRFDDIGLR